MSAIFGILRFDGQQVAAADLERMGNTIAHRGPNGRRSETAGAVGMGHLLMRVTHEDWHEAQPVHDRAAKLSLVADARIDNREALAATLDFAVGALAGMPDSALILAAYRRWGEDCVDHLIGDFAFALWDGAARKLVLVRDHMGQRTLLYSLRKDFLVFATETRALWAIEGVPRQISESALGHRLLLSGAMPAGMTFHEGIEGLPGGSIVTVGADGKFALRRYWRPHADPRHEGRDEAYYVATYRALLTEAVACRIRRAIKPAALLISGGYDSAAIAGLAGEVLRPQGRKLIGVSSVLAEGRDQEFGNARRWVEACRRHMPHLDVHYFTRKDENVLTRLEEYFLVAGVPASNTHFLRTALFESAAAAGAQVVMDGYGGDYTINPRGFGSLAYLLRTGALRAALPHAVNEARRRGKSIASVIFEALWALVPLPIIAAKRRLWRLGAPLWRDFPIQSTFAKRLYTERTIQDGMLRFRSYNRSKMRTKMLETLEHLSNLPTAAVPASPAARGLEFTMPFHDKRIVEFGLAIPEALYAKNGQDRFLAHCALADVLPPELLKRRWGGNDTHDPDRDEMIACIRDRLLAKVEDMAADERLKRYIDFDRLRAGLCNTDPLGGRRRTVAMLTLLAGQYLQWFDRQNR